MHQLLVLWLHYIKSYFELCDIDFLVMMFYTIYQIELY